MESDGNSRDTNLDIKQKDEHAKEKMKENTDRKAQAQVSDLKIGETVLLSQMDGMLHTTSLSSRRSFQIWSSQSYQMMICWMPGKRIMRILIFLKEIHN